MINLGMRNLKIYLRDGGGVFFSFLGILIIIGLYVLFLGNGMKEEVVGLPEGGLMVDSWVMAGIIAVASVTTSLGACGVMVDDKVKKNGKDLLSAPLKRYQIVGGYVFSACLIGLLMCIMTFAAAEIYLVASGCTLPAPLTMLKIMGVIILAVLSSGSMVLFITSFLKTNGAFSNVSIIIGTLIGFLTGMYLPVGTLSENVQWLIKCFPASSACVLLRQLMMEETMKVSFEGVPAEIIEGFEQEMGVVFTYGSTTGTAGLHIAVLAATAVIFFTLAILNISRKAK